MTKKRTIIHGECRHWIKCIFFPYDVEIYGEERARVPMADIAKKVLHRGTLEWQLEVSAGGVGGKGCPVGVTVEGKVWRWLGVMKGRMNAWPPIA